MTVIPFTPDAAAQERLRIHALRAVIRSGGWPQPARVVPFGGMMRACLVCDGKFMSFSSTQRVCAGCKASADKEQWRA